VKIAVKLVDTTLRDGEQAPGLAFSLASRMLLAEAMDKAGIFQLEVGCPAMGSREVESFKAIKSVCQRALVSAWNRVRVADARASLSSGADLIHLCLPVSKSHLEKKLRLSWSSLSAELTRCLQLVRDGGVEVSVGLEDASRATEEELNRAADLLEANGVKLVRLSDTVGVLTPTRVRSLVSFLVKRGFLVEFHGHNDLGLAAANALVAALAGAERLDVTLSGVGERVGNCALANFVALTSDKLELGVTPLDALRLENLARPLLDRQSYVQSLLASPTPDIDYILAKFADPGRISIAC
jgi:homocitrate synthase NifV